MIESVITEPSKIKVNENFKIKVKVTDFNTATEEGESVTLDNSKDNGKMKFVLEGQTSQEVKQAEAGTEVTGTDITISDYNTSKESKFTKFSGDTFQQSYTGKNLFNMTDFVSGSDANVTISNNSMTQTVTDTRTNLNMIVRKYNSGTASQDYIFKQEITQNGFYQATFTKDSSFNQIRVGHSGNSKNMWALFNIGYLTDGTIYTISFNVVNCVQANGMYVIEDFQIEEGSATSYEPYVGGTASPNPDYPQPIQVVTGENSVKVSNKNLFKSDYFYEVTNHGVTLSFNNGDIILNNTASGEANFNSKYFYISSLSNFALSGGTNDVTIAILFYTSNGDYIRTYRDTGSGISGSVPSNAGKYHLNIRISNATSLNNYVVKGQLEAGSTPTTYIKHAEQNFTLNLGSIELAKIGTYADYIFHNIPSSPYYNSSLTSGSWYKKAYIGKRTLTSNDISNVSNSYTNIKYYRFTKLENDINYGTNSNSNTLFTHATKSGGGLDNASNIGKYLGSAAQGYYWVGFAIGTTLAKAQTALNGSIFYYVLATPTNTEITDTTLISQLNSIEEATGYAGTTYIISTNATGLAIIPSYHYNFVTARPTAEMGSTIQLVTGNNTITVKNSDNSQSQSFQVDLDTIELLKIGTSKDYIYRSEGVWYKHEAIGKATDTIGSTGKTISDMKSGGGFYSYYGGTLAGQTITYDNAITDTNTIYYEKDTTTEIEITDNDLITQLEALRQAHTYLSETNISQTNADLPFWLVVTGEVEND